MDQSDEVEALTAGWAIGLHEALNEIERHLTEAQRGLDAAREALRELERLRD
ncbi:hypothetical protein ACIO13_35780 [Streptomyces sp. NPDC087425]|uniref:hypothetical protein n=1 Tax=Streptomyces sp. NPDC087425 TaxID=3365787 RepID=UPI00380DBA6D